MYVSEFFDLLKVLGLTKESVVPPIVVLGVAFWLLNKYVLKSVKSDIASIKTDAVPNIRSCVTDVHNAVREMQEFIKQEKENDKSVQDWKPLHGLENKPDWSTANSPISLSEKGRALLVESGINAFIGDKEGDLIKKIDDLKPTTAYDVQKFSYSVLRGLVFDNTDMHNKIKDFVYHNPEFKGSNVDVPDVLYVGSIELRDKYLSTHQELSSNRN